jgi:hypothetical protein
MSHAQQKTAHRVYENIAHSNIVSDIVGVGEMAVGALITVGTLGGGAGVGLGLMAAGGATIVQSVAGGKASVDAASEAKQNINQISPTGGVPTSGSPYTPPAVSGAGGNAPGGTGPQTVPYGTDVLQEKADAANLQQVAYEQQSLEQILNLKEQELTTEGAITSGQASRGVKAGEGTAGIQLATQKQLGQGVIGSAVSQQAIGDKAQSEASLASWNAGLLGLSNETLGINQNLQTEQSDLWLGSLTSMIGYASSALSRFWTPSGDAGSQQTLQQQYSSPASNNWMNGEYG